MPKTDEQNRYKESKERGKREKRSLNTKTLFYVGVALWIGLMILAFILFLYQ